MKRVKVKVLCCFLLLLICVLLMLCNRYYQTQLLFEAIEKNDIAAANIAIQNGALINQRRHMLNIPSLVNINDTPLSYACYGGNMEIVSLLLNHGANVNQVDPCTEMTPLIRTLLSAHPNRFSIADILIRQGADVHARAKFDTVVTAALCVSIDDSEDVRNAGVLLLQYLMEQEVDTTVYWPGNHHLLTYAVWHNNVDAVRFLIENGYYEVDQQTTSGTTALMIAAANNRIDCAKSLIVYGADISKTDVNGMTAVDYAIEKNEPGSELIKLLMFY